MVSTDEPVASADPDTGSGGVSRAILVVSVVVALAIGGVVGVAVGWKVEQNRVKDDIEDIRPVGTVTAVEGKSITVALQTADGTRTYVITPETKIDRAQVGDAADVEEGSIVLVRNFRNGDGQHVASEIVVLPKSTNLDSR